MKNLTRFVFTLTAAAAVWSCDEGCKLPYIEPGKVPQVVLSAASSTQTAVSFKLTSEGATACAYMVTEKAAGITPDAATVLKEGAPVEAENTVTCEKDGLEPDTVYEVWAAASNEAGYSEVKSVEIKTLAEGEKRLPSVVIRTGEASETALWFTLEFTDAAEGAYAVVPKGDEVPDAAAILKDGSRADVSAAQEYEAGGLEAGQAYIIAAAASNADGLSEVVTAEMQTEEGPSLPGLEADVTNHAFAHVERMNYFGDLYEKGTGFYVIALRDREADADGNYPAGTAQLCFELHADLSASAAGMLPAGTYTVNSEILPGTCVPGRIIAAIPDGYQPDCTYFGLNGQYGMVESGTVKVEKNGETYRIAFDFRTADGHSVTASYEGDLKVPGGTDPIDPDATTTLTDNYDIQFAPGEGTVVNAYYYGYDAELKADVWSVYMEPKVKNMQADGFMMDLLVDPAPGFAGGFPAGTPDAPHEYNNSSFGEPGHYIPGQYDEEGTMVYTWYLGGYVEIAPGEWRVTRYAAAAVGYIYISKSGSDYTISVEYSDENWRTVTGTWTGAVAVSDRSASGIRPQAVSRR